MHIWPQVVFRNKRLLSNQNITFICWNTTRCSNKHQHFQARRSICHVASTFSHQGFHRSSTVRVPVSNILPKTTMAASAFSTRAQLQAKHEPENERFIVQLGSAEAVLEYEETSPGILDLYHTEVPKPLRGKAIGQLLAKAAFDYVADNNLKMKLSCTYLQHYNSTSTDGKYNRYVV